MKKITVFTPTFNRAHLLPRLYESLCAQTSQDFLWMLIDDGSTDNTQELVEAWTKENKIEIQYFFKQNGGMHTGHNLAYQNIQTELNVCIDSDDYMPVDAIELIVRKWEGVANKEKLAGIIGLDAFKNGELVGTKIPEHLNQGNLYDLYKIHQVKGDKKIVLRTEVVKQYPAYPEFEGEKLVPLGLLYLMIGKNYDWLYTNEVYCIVEYQEDGSSNSILKQYKQSPKGFAYARKVKIQYLGDFKNQFKNHIHLISSAIFAKDIQLAFQGVNPLLTILALPFGLLLNLYIQLKIK